MSLKNSGESKMKCPTCNRAKLVIKKVEIELDGSEYAEFKCPKCKKLFMDIKIVNGYRMAS